MLDVLLLYVANEPHMTNKDTWDNTISNTADQNGSFALDALAINFRINFYPLSLASIYDLLEWHYQQHSNTADRNASCTKFQNNSAKPHQQWPSLLALLVWQFIQALKWHLGGSSLVFLIVQYYIMRSVIDIWRMGWVSLSPQTQYSHYSLASLYTAHLTLYNTYMCT